MRRVRPAVVVAAVTLVVAGVWTASAGATGDDLPMARPVVVTAPFHETADTVRRNETLAVVLGRHGIGAAELYRLLQAAPALKPRRVPAGQVFEFRYLGAGAEPARIRTRVSPDEMLWVRRDADGAWHQELEPILWNPEPVRLIGTVQGSLYETLSDLMPDSVLPRAERDRMIYDLADEVFGWEIDFTRDVVAGDHFAILFERLVSSLGEARYGRLLAARLEARGEEHTAFVLTGPDGGNEYYDADGRSLKRAFKLAPVPYRITSHFSRSRFHPILGIWRAHLGNDYHAPIGTPVEATGDGVVRRANRWDGYGLMVALRHPHGIETRYAHLSRLAQGIHPGVAVKQGDVIGYSGMSGLATAPHVHYEFLKNGHQVNPSRVDLGDGTPVPAARRAEFATVRDHFEHLLDEASPPVVAFGPN
jgi:murein DD-endopeptidase MepM/ murein hydrolase activator NlpD